MKKKIDLPTALQNRVSGKKVTVVLDMDIAFLMLSTLMRLDDIGADFLADIPDEAPHTEVVDPAVPAITIKQMEGDILESPPRRIRKRSP